MGYLDGAVQEIYSDEATCVSRKARDYSPKNK